MKKNTKNKQEKNTRKDVNFRINRQKERGYVSVFWVIIIVILALSGVLFWMGYEWFDTRMDFLENKQQSRLKNQTTNNQQPTTKNQQAITGGREKTEKNKIKEDNLSSDDQSDDQPENAATVPAKTPPEAATSETALNVAGESQAANGYGNEVFYLKEGIITSYYIDDKTIKKEDIAKRAITNSLLKSNAVTTRVIDDYTILGEDLAKDIDIETSGKIEADEMEGETITATDLTATSAVLTALSTNSISIGGTDIGDLYLSKSGGTLTGSLILAHDPTEAMEAATKSYVDAATAGGISTFTGLTDTISSYNSGRVLFESSSGVTDSAGFTYSGSILTVSNVTISGLSASTTSDSVIVEESGALKSRTIDSRVWGSSLVDLTGTPASGYAVYWSDANTLAAEQYLSVSRGGTGWDSSSQTGIAQVTAGSWSAVTGTDNYLPKWSSNSLTGTSLIYDDGSSIGIGTNSPTGILNIWGSGTQMRLSYDLSNYADFAVDDSGNLTIQASGTSGITAIGSGDTVVNVDSTGLMPDTDNIYDLGSAGYRWRDIYLGPGSLKMYNSYTDAGNYEMGKLSFNSNILTLASSAAGSGTVRDLQITTGSHVGIYLDNTNGYVGIGTATPGEVLHVQGSIRTSNLAGTGNRCVYVTSSGTLAAKSEDCGTASGGDNLGDHTATQNIELGNYWLSGDGDNEGVFVTSGGYVGIGTNNPGAALEVRGGVAAGTNGTEFTVSTAGAVTGGTYNGQTISSAASFTGSLTAAGAVSGASLSDGTLTITSGNITGAGAITASGIITGGTLTDGTATITGGTLTGTTLTDGTFSVTSGIITGATWQGNTVAVGYGGTGAATFTQYGVLFGNGTSALQVTAAGSTNQVLVGTTGAAPSWAAASSLAGQIEHGSITGLSDDDHSQYALLAGRSGGQILIGGIDATDGLTLQTTSATGTTGADMHFLVGDNGGTEALTILNNGYVGVGTASPEAKLEIEDTSADVLVRLTSGGEGYDSRLYLGEVDKNGMTFEYDGADNIGYIGMNDNVAPTGAWSKRIQMSRSGTEVAFMSGNVGIGTTSPGAKLHVAGEIFADVVAGGNPNINLTANSVADYLRFNIFYDGGTKYSYDGGAGDIRLIKTTSGQEGDIAFRTAPNGTAGNAMTLTERMRITQDGNVGIGTTSPNISGIERALTIYDGTLGHASGLELVGNRNSASQATGQVIFENTQSSQTSKRIALISGQIGSSGDLDSGALRFAVADTGGTLIDAMIIDDDGQIGIGTTSPGEKLHVDGGGIKFQSDSSGGAGAGNLSFDNSTKLLTLYNTYSGDTARINFDMAYSGEKTIMSLIRSGYVGIGTTSPGEKLDINGGDVLIDNQMDSTIYLGKGAEGVDGVTKIKSYQSGADTDQLGLRFFVHNSTTGSSYCNHAMTIDHNSYVGIGTTGPDYTLEVFGSSLKGGSGTNGFSPTGLIFDAGANTAHQLMALGNNNGELFTVLGAGYIGIGSTNPSYLLQMEASGGGYYSTSDHSWHDASSIRYKENIEEIDDALSIINQLQGVRYDWKEEYGGAADIGFIAEDVGQVLPEVVSWDKDDPSYANGISYAKMTALLAEGIKETNAKFDPLLEQIVKDANNNLNLDSVNNQIIAKDFLNATADGLSTKVINDPINGVTDDDFQVSPTNLNGAMAIDSANGRLYFRYADKWHYVNQTGGFQIPNYETAPMSQLNSKARKSKNESLPYESSAYDDYLTEKLMPGDFLIPYVDEYLPDGAVHGLYARFSDVKGKMFQEEQEKLDSLVTLADSNLQSISDLESAIDENFSLVGGRLDELEERLEDLEWQATNNEEAIENLGNEQTALKSEQADLSAGQDALTSSQNNLNTRLTQLENLFKQNNGVTDAELEFWPQFIGTSDEGVLTMETDALIEGKLTVKELEAEKMAAGSAAIDDMEAKSLKLSKDTSGIVTLAAGETEIIVETSQANPDNYIYFSPIGSTFNRGLYVDEIVPGESFKIKLEDTSRLLEEDIKLNWLIIIGQ